MGVGALWSVVVLSVISTSYSDVTLLSLTAENTINVQEGETITFVCSNSDIEGPEILQINNNIEDDSFSRVTVLNATQDTADSGTAATCYQFADIVRSDNGTIFQCFVNAVSSNFLTVIVDFPPRYVPDVYNYVVIEGTSLRIQFQLDALKTVTSFTWTRDGSQIQSNTGTMLAADYIDFGPVGREDTGSYLVIAQDSVGTGNASLLLDVYYPPEFDAGSGVVNRSIVAGSSSTLDCAVNSNPTTVPSLSVQDVASTANVQMTLPQFQITEAIAGNEGYYICTAENDIAIVQLIYSVIVGELPNVVVEIQVSLATEAITLVGMYTETNSEDPVIRFYVTVAGNTVSTQPDSSSFSVSLGYDGLEPGTTYTVSVVAENVIGNGTVQTPQTFTVPVDTEVSSGATASVIYALVLLLIMLATLFQ